MASEQDETAFVLEQVSRHAIVPELLDDCDTSIAVDWQIGSIQIKPGKFILPEESAAPSTIVLRRAPAGRGKATVGTVTQGCSAEDDSDAAELYCVIIIDPDAPMGLDQVLHGAVFNCSLGCDVLHPASGCLVLQGHRGAGPPARSGRHRYVAFAFQQPSCFTAQHAQRHVASVGMDVGVAAARLGLGVPVGVNFYISQFDGSFWLTCMSALMCRCCIQPPASDWFERAEAKLLER